MSDSDFAIEIINYQVFMTSYFYHEGTMYGAISLKFSILTKDVRHEKVEKI